MNKTEKSFLKRVVAGVTLMSLELLIVWTIFIASLYVFWAVFSEIFIEKEYSIDESVFAFLNTIVSPQNTMVMQTFSFLASKEFIFIVCILILLYFLFIKKHKWYSIKVPVVALGSISLNVVLKYLFNRPRPLLPHLSEASGLSFPSGHAMVSFSFYGLLIYLTWVNAKHKPLKYTLVLFLLILIFFIGLSRVYLRVHYATDVLAGFALGIIWLIISIVVLKRLEKFSGRNIDPIVEEE